MKNKTLVKIISAFLAVVMLFGIAPLSSFWGGDLSVIKAEAKSLSDCAVGDIIEFGTYPQTLVQDSSLKSSLNSISKTWRSYGYYSGTESVGTMFKDNWMKYADITYGGNKYRAVTFSQYRPYNTYYQCSSSNSYQDDNGYNTNTVYYFKYEPLKWRVLDPDEGLVMCESIIDSQPYSNTIFYENSKYYNDTLCTTYANDYATSSIRDWLNDDFYNTAFTTAEKNEIKKSVQDNSCWNSSYPEYDSATTNDKIFLLSYNEVTNSAYGFSSDSGDYDTARRAQGTDYAKCQGLYVSTSSGYYGNSYWRLRSPGGGSYIACGVGNDGDVYSFSSVTDTIYGIRPALKFNPKSVIFESFYTQEHTVSSYAENNAKYENTYFGGEAAALDGTKNTPDMVIPGLKNGENMVPQGVAYYAKKNWLLVSSYYKDKTKDSSPCMIFALDFDTGELVAEYKLKRSATEDFTGHVGGIAVSNYNLYITDNKQSGISYVPLSRLDSQSGSLTVAGTKNMSSYLGSAKPAYLSIDDGMLITGNFFYAKNSKYDTPAKGANSVILAQNLSGNSSANEWSNFCSSAPFATVKVPDSIDRIQGAVCRDEKFYLSSSFGRTNTSTLYIADIDKSNGYSLKNIKSYKALPMMEDMEFIGDYIYTAFESASAFYLHDLDDDSKTGKSKHPTDVIWQIDYKALIGEDSVNTVTGDVENATVNFVQGDTTGSVNVSFKQNWFKDDSVNYNHNLAKLTSQYVMLGYSDAVSYSSKPNLENALKAIGMNNVEIVAQAGRDDINYFIASRKVTVNSKEYDLVFVGLIGSYHAQWYSNFDPGTGAVHQGFLSAKQFVYSALTNYIKAKGFSKDSTKILIAGHSRGAAASNLLAADLIKGGVYAKPENIYTYAFATPNSTTLPERTDAKFNRIYNIVNPEDFVTKCMPAEWGYGRYGQTYVLPSKTNTSSSGYSKYKSNMQLYYDSFTDGDTYKPYSGGEADTRSVVDSMTSSIDDVNEFYNKTLWVGIIPMSAYKFFQDSLCHVVSKEADLVDWVSLAAIAEGTLTIPTSSRVFKDVLVYFLMNGTGLNPCFENAHKAETYCAYMMSMTESQVKQPRQAYKNTVNCPVDVTVIDNETSEVVGKIVNNIIDKEIAAKENSVVMTVDGDSKSFWLPSDGDYEVILTGNDNGTMDYTVSEVDSDLGETERVNFYDIEITDGDRYTGEIVSDNFDVEEYTITSESGEVIPPDEKLDNSSMQSVEINVTVSGKGYATDSMAVTKGDYVTLEATPEDGYKFDGWYENNKRVSKEKTYSFVAKEEHTFVAKFSKNKPSVISTIETDYTWDFNINKYLRLNEDLEYEITYKSSDPSVATVDEDGYITTVGRGTTLITSTIVYENGETEVQLNNVEVVYNWWQWLIVIFLFGWIWY